MIELQSRAPLSRYAFIGLHGALMEAASLLPLGNVLAEAGDGLLLDLGGHGSALDQALTGWPMTLNRPAASSAAVFQPHRLAGTSA